MNQKDKHNFTSLHYAAREDKLETVKLLVDNSADINNVDVNGDKPVQWAESTRVTVILTELAPELSTEDINRENIYFTSQYLWKGTTRQCNT